MRVLRRIAGQPKYKAGQWTDEKVRVCLSMPEILCYISQNRLCYLVQLAKGRADTLLSLLNVSCQLPWVIQVEQDLVQLWTDRHHMSQSLGHPIDGLGGLHYTVSSPVEATGAQLDSAVDESATKGGYKRKTPKEYVFKCGTCGVCFEGDRALRCHEQVVQKKRTPVKHLLCLWCQVFNETPTGCSSE